MDRVARTPVELTEAVRAMAEATATIAVAEGSQARARALAEAVPRLVPDVDDAGVWLTERGAVLVAAAGQVAAVLDQAQLEAQEGPCWDALHRGVRVLAGDLGKDPRWPKLHARSPALRSMASLPMRIGPESSGSLNVFAQRHDLGPEAVEAAEAIAAAGAHLLREAGRLEGLVSERQQLQHALARRDVIGQAKGILMAQRSITSDEAFQVLVERSQALNRKLYDLALDLAYTGELPPVPASRGKGA